MSLVANEKAKYAKQTGGRGQYGHVVLRLIVDGPDTGITVENALPDAARLDSNPQVVSAPRREPAERH